MTTAQAYDSLLARRDFDRLQQLFAEDAVYLSPAVGSCQGKAAIMTMLRTFFAQHPTAAWESAHWRLEQGEVAHDYKLTLPTAPPALRERSGVERMGFAADGRISRILVTG